MIISIPALEKACEGATKGPLELSCYEHGGGRMRHGDNHLIADFYDAGNRDYYALLPPEVVSALVEVTKAAHQCIETYAFCQLSPFQPVIDLTQALAAFDFSEERK